MKELIGSNMFIPMVILVAAAIISVIVLIVFSKKKKSVSVYLNDGKLSLDKPTSDIEQRIADEAILPVVETKTNTQDVIPSVPIEKESVLPSVPMSSQNDLPDIPKVEEQVVVEPTIKKVELPSGPPPVIDIPIPTVDDTPITVEEVKSLVGENLKDSVEVEKFNVIDESNINQEELINVEEAKQLVESNQEEITVEETKSLVNENGESIQISEVKPITNDMGETAFKSIPSGNHDINTDIHIEPVEPEINKTEIFSLDEIKKEMNKEENKRDLL